MPINHSRRLSQPKNKTVIDPVTKKIVFYSDYLKMEKEGNDAATLAQDDIQDENGSQTTERQKNSGTDNGDGWSSDHNFDSEDNDDVDNDNEPNKDETDSVLLLGVDTTNQDTSMQAKLAAALNKKPHETRKEMFQAKAALRRDKLTSDAQRKNKKKSSKTTSKSSIKSKPANTKKSTSSKKTTTSNTKTSKNASKQKKTIVIESSSSSPSNTSDSESSSSVSSVLSSSSSSTSSHTDSSSSSHDSNASSHKKTSNMKKAKTKSSQRDKSSKNDNYYQPIADDKKTKRRMSKAERRASKKIQRKIRTIFTLKIRINKNEDSVKELFSQTKKWFDKLQQVDKRAIVYAYNDKEPTSALMSSTELPDDYAVYKNFFSGTKTQEEEGWTWATIWLGHDMPLESLLESMGKWSRKTMTWMFAKHLQEKDTVKEYFLLWSTGNLDAKLLHKNVMDTINAAPDGREYSFAFAWNAVKGEDNNIIRRPKAFKGERDSDRIVRALHIEVPRSKKDYIYRRLQQVFGLNNRTRILGRRLLMVPIIRPTTPTHKIIKIKHLIDKQMKFLMNIKTAKIWDFTEIDYPHAVLGLTAREMIMGIPPLDGSDAAVFLGVDYNKRDECFEVTFPKYLDTQVRDIIAQLPSIIAYIYTDQALELMTPSAQERAVDAPWDEDAMCAISKEDREMDKMLQESRKMGFNDDDSDESGDTIFHFELEDPAQLARSRRLFHKTSNNDSITSLNTFEDANVANKTPRDESTTVTDNPSPPKRTKRPSDNDDISALGDDTTYTSASRINDIERSVSNLSDMMHAFLKQQNFTYTPSTTDREMEDTTIHDDDSLQNRESAMIVTETPEAHAASGELL